jgi:hypothetical protein
MPRINKDATEFFPDIWVGNVRSALSKQFISEMSIKYIINLTADATHIFNTIEYMSYPVHGDDICFTNLDEIFDKCSLFIHTAQKNKKGILIFSKESYHISATFLAAFMIKYINMTYLEAIVYINGVRRNTFEKNTCLLNSLLNYYLKEK